MECKFCEGQMRMVWSGGDGYHEPREEQWVCEECGAVFDWTQGVGGTWTDKNGDEYEDE